MNPATATSLTQSLNPSAFGQPVTFTARVTVTAPSNGPATGLVEFRVGATVLGTAPLSTLAGVTSATFTTDPFDLPVGANQTITAEYLGDGNYATSSRRCCRRLPGGDDDHDHG